MLAGPSETRTRGIRVRNQVAKPKVLRCAIYTRKSSEEGLEQDFNSLHAQRESCKAYIKSQKHEGWVALPFLYDDGGYRKDRTLTINEDEARTVRTIFELFLKLKNVREVQAELARLKLTTKPYPISTGKVL